MHGDNIMMMLDDADIVSYRNSQNTNNRKKHFSLLHWMMS